MTGRTEAEMEQREAAYDTALEKAAKATTLIAALFIGSVLVVMVFDLPNWGLYVTGAFVAVCAGVILWRYRPVAQNREHRIAIAKTALTGVAVLGGWNIAYLFITRLEMPVWGRVGVGIVFMAGHLAYLGVMFRRR